MICPACEAFFSSAKARNKNARHVNLGEIWNFERNALTVLDRHKLLLGEFTLDVVWNRFGRDKRVKPSQTAHMSLGGKHLDFVWNHFDSDRRVKAMGGGRSVPIFTDFHRFFPDSSPTFRRIFYHSLLRALVGVFFVSHTY